LVLESKNEVDLLIEAYDNKELFDFTIKIADKSILANKIILYCRSSFFREFFEKDPNASEITLDTVFDLFAALVSEISLLKKGN
jgi:hypothetical protein